MFSNKLSAIAAFLALFPAYLAPKTPDLTLENLHTVTLNPTNSITGKKVKYIPQWFEFMKKKGIPSQGAALIPTNTLSSFWEFKKGIPNNQKNPIFIHSSCHDGFWGRLVHGRTGHAFRCTNAWLKHSIINGTFVTFDYLFDRKDFDFGQGINIEALNTIYSQIKRNNPEAPLVIAATCIGAKIALEFTIAHTPKNLSALILETPFIDVNKFIGNMGKNYMGWFPFTSATQKANVIKSISQVYAPNCADSYKKGPADLTKMNPQLPIFIAHLKDDALYSDQEMHELVTALQKSGNKHIYLLVIKDKQNSAWPLESEKRIFTSMQRFSLQI